MGTREPEVIDGLAVRQHWTGHFWDVRHEASGLNVAGYLRQRRFAEQARDELLALGIDWTAGKAEAARQLREHPGAMAAHTRWSRRVRTRGNDPTTHEWYSASLSLPGRPNSAARAAELRAADRRDVISDPGGLAAWGADGGN